MGILLSTAALQVLIVEFGYIAFSVSKGGLSLRLWGYSLLFGFISLPVQQVINLVYKCFQQFKTQRNGHQSAKQAGNMNGTE